MALLSVRDMHVYYGSIHAIKGISFDVEEGEVVTLIGANGAGKSTTLKTVLHRIDTTGFSCNTIVTNSKNGATGTAINEIQCYKKAK